MLHQQHSYTSQGQQQPQALKGGQGQGQEQGPGKGGRASTNANANHDEEEAANFVQYIRAHEPNPMVQKGAKGGYGLGKAVGGGKGLCGGASDGYGGACGGGYGSGGGYGGKTANHWEIDQNRQQTVINVRPVPTGLKRQQLLDMLEGLAVPAAYQTGTGHRAHVREGERFTRGTHFDYLYLPRHFYEDQVGTKQGPNKGYFFINFTSIDLMLAFKEVVAQGLHIETCHANSRSNPYQFVVGWIDPMVARGYHAHSSNQGAPKRLMVCNAWDETRCAAIDRYSNSTLNDGEKLKYMPEEYKPILFTPSGSQEAIPPCTKRHHTYADRCNQQVAVGMGSSAYDAAIGGNIL